MELRPVIRIAWFDAREQVKARANRVLHLLVQKQLSKENPIGGTAPEDVVHEARPVGADLAIDPLISFHSQLRAHTHVLCTVIRNTRVCPLKGGQPFGAGRATTRAWRGLSDSISVLIAPPFPAASRLSNRTTIFSPVALTHPEA